MASWWSASKGELVELESMHDNHLRSAFQKLQRGDYTVPREEPDEIEGDLYRSITADERIELETAFQAEFARRGLNEVGERFPEHEGGLA